MLICRNCKRLVDPRASVYGYIPSCPYCKEEKENKEEKKEEKL